MLTSDHLLMLSAAASPPSTSAADLMPMSLAPEEQRQRFRNAHRFQTFSERHEIILDESTRQMLVTSAANNTPIVSYIEVTLRAPVFQGAQPAHTPVMPLSGVIVQSIQNNRARLHFAGIIDGVYVQWDGTVSLAPLAAPPERNPALVQASGTDGRMTFDATRAGD